MRHERFDRNSKGPSMSAGRERAAGEPKAEERYLQDPPKEVVRLDECQEIKVEIEKLSKGLKEGEDWLNYDPRAREAPKIIMAGGLDEARAYVPSIEPVTHPEHATIEMRRVRVVDPRNAITERIEPIRPDRIGVSATKSAEAGDGVSVPSAGRARTARRPSTNALIVFGVMGALAGAIAILGVLLRRPASGDVSGDSGSTREPASALQGAAPTARATNASPAPHEPVVKGTTVATASPSTTVSAATTAEQPSQAPDVAPPPLTVAQAGATAAPSPSAGRSPRAVGTASSGSMAPTRTAAASPSRATGDLPQPKPVF